MMKRIAILSIVVIAGVTVGVLLANRGAFQKAKVDSVAVCVYDPGKTTQDCICPFVGQAITVLRSGRDSSNT